MINLLKSSHDNETSFQERVSIRDRKKEEEGRDDRTQLDKYRERAIRERDKDPKEHKKEKQRDQKERESMMKEKEDNNIAAAALDETTIIHEVAIGKGLSGALNLLKDRGALKQSSSTTSAAEWGAGRKLEVENNGVRRTDEYGRILTPKQEFRLFCHKFHGKGPGKKKQEKRVLQYQEELKVKHMNNSDTPSFSAQRTREAQARLKSPYLVLSGCVKPAAAAAAQTTSDGFKCKSQPGGNMGEPADMGPTKKKLRISS